MKYRIERFYQNDSRFKAREIVKTGLTLEEAQAHCQDPETSSRTCTSAEGLERTKKHGPWFDAYEEHVEHPDYPGATFYKVRGIDKVKYGNYPLAGFIGLMAGSRPSRR